MNPVKWLLPTAQRVEQSERRRVKAYFINPGVIPFPFYFGMWGVEGIKLSVGR